MNWPIMPSSPSRGALWELADRVGFKLLSDHAEEMEGTEDDADTPIRVPRIPINTIEARKMLAFIDYADGYMYAGYTGDELAVLPGGRSFQMTTDAFRRSLDA